MRKLLVVAGLLGALAIPVAAPSAVLEKARARRARPASVRGTS